MENVIVLGFAWKEQAEDALRGLRQLHKNHDVELEVAAVVERRADGRVDVRDLCEALHLRTAAASGVVGGLVGFLAGPVGVLLGGATGAAVGSLVDVAEAESADDLVRRFSEMVVPRSAATIAVVHEPGSLAVNRLASDLGATLLRRRRADVEREIRDAEKALVGAQRVRELKRTPAERLHDVTEALLDRR